jgi:peptide/nickel transport system permease protein
VLETAAGPRPGRLRGVTQNVWLRFAARRLLGLVLVLFLLTVAVFATIRLIPGDPAEIFLGDQALPQEVAQYRADLGLNEPAYRQFFTFVGNLFHGDLGESFRTHQPVAQIISERLPNSLELAGLSLAFVLMIGIPLGLLMGALTREGRHRRLEVGYQATTQVLATIPEFLVATAVAYFFAVKFQLLPVAGDEGWKTIILPMVALVTGSTAAMSRFVRVETLNVLARDYIRTARSAQLSTSEIYFRHVLPNVLTAALTIGGLIFSGLIGGTVIVENVFARPGLGTAITDAMSGRDYPVIQGLILVLGAIVVITNAIVDLMLALIDKRTLARES